MPVVRSTLRVSPWKDRQIPFLQRIPRADSRGVATSKGAGETGKEEQGIGEASQAGQAAQGEDAASVRVCGAGESSR